MFKSLNNWKNYIVKCVLIKENPCTRYTLGLLQSHLSAKRKVFSLSKFPPQNIVSVFKLRFQPIQHLRYVTNVFYKFYSLMSSNFSDVNYYSTFLSVLLILKSIFVEFRYTYNIQQCYKKRRQMDRLLGNQNALFSSVG